MLRYHALICLGLFILGIVGYKTLPDVPIPLPWTAVVLLFTAMAVAGVFAFRGQTSMSSPVIAAENVRLTRYMTPIKYVSDGKMTWAFIPANGWMSLLIWLVGKNTAVVIMPASLLESESEYALIARCKLYRLTPRSVHVLMKKRIFKQALADLGHTEERPFDVYYGFHSTTLHADSECGVST